MHSARSHLKDVCQQNSSWAKLISSDFIVNECFFSERVATGYWQVLRSVKVHDIFRNSYFVTMIKKIPGTHWRNEVKLLNCRLTMKHFIPDLEICIHSSLSKDETGIKFVRQRQTNEIIANAKLNPFRDIFSLGVTFVTGRITAREWDSCMITPESQKH